MTESYVTMPTSSVLELAKRRIEFLGVHNDRRLAIAIADYRKGWWIFKPSPKLTDQEIERELRRGLRFFDQGWVDLDVAKRLVSTLSVAGVGDTVFVSTADLEAIR